MSDNHNFSQPAHSLSSQIDTRPLNRVNGRCRSVLRALKIVVGNALLAMFFFYSATVQPQGFSKEMDLWRLGVNDLLIIDRSGPVSHAGDVNGDGLVDVILAVGVGAVRVVFGPTTGFNGTLNATSLSGSNGFSINGDGPHVSTAGDVNGDGVSDLMIGSEMSAYVVMGNRDGFEKFFDVANLNGQNGFSVPVNTSSVSDAGDINNDGIDDMLIGSASRGEVYVIYGSKDGFPASIDPASLDGSNGFTLVGTAKNLTGWSVGSAGDFNADEIDDFMLGAPGTDIGANSESGAAYLIYGTAASRPAKIDLNSLKVGEGLIFEGSGFERATGKSVSFVGDLNRDGVDDIGIGAPGKGPFGEPSEYPGRIFVLLGSHFQDQLIVRQSDFNGRNGFSISGIRGGVVPQQPGEKEFGDMAGESIDYAGDINGDGLDDMIIGAHQTIITAARDGVGSAYLVYGRSGAWPTSMGLDDLDGSNGFVLKGTGTTDYTGFSVSRAGDFSGDGVDDVIIGAAGEGISYLFYGKSTGATAGEIQNIARPAGLTASVYSVSDLELFWNRSRLPLSGYDIQRNGQYLTTVGANRTSYFDTGLEPGATYQYTLTAVAANGVVSPPAEIVVDLSDASQASDPVEEPIEEPVQDTDAGGEDGGTDDPVDQPDEESDSSDDSIADSGEDTNDDPNTDPQNDPTSDPVDDGDNESQPIVTGADGTGSAGWVLLLLLVLLTLSRCYASTFPQRVANRNRNTAR